VQWNKTYSTIALATSAMECIPLHSWEMEFSIQYHVTINSQLNDQNSIRYYIIKYIRPILVLTFMLNGAWVKPNYVTLPISACLLWYDACWSSVVKIMIEVAMPMVKCVLVCRCRFLKCLLICWKQCNALVNWCRYICLIILDGWLEYLFMYSGSSFAFL
jgi:hypothetical protein